MTEEKTFIIGDIHGCLDALKRVLDKIAWRPDKDRLIFVGDYIDRGQDPKGVIDFLLALKKISDKIDCLLGNHEAVFLDYLLGGNGDMFLMNGGVSTLASYNLDQFHRGHTLSIPSEHLRFYQTLKPILTLDDYYVVHAGFRPGVPVDQQTLMEMLWIRKTFIYSHYDFGKKVIFGHTPLEKPLVMDNKIGIDTGAVFGNKLTCLELPEMRFHSSK